MTSIHEDLLYNLNLLLSNHKHAFLPNILAYHGMKLEKDYCLFCNYLQAVPDYYKVLNLNYMSFINQRNNSNSYMVALMKLPESWACLPIAVNSFTTNEGDWASLNPTTKRIIRGNFSS